MVHFVNFCFFSDLVRLGHHSLKTAEIWDGLLFSPAMVIINRGQGPVIAGSPAGIGVGEGASGKSQLGSSEMW